MYMVAILLVIPMKANNYNHPLDLALFSDNKTKSRGFSNNLTYGIMIVTISIDIFALA